MIDRPLRGVRIANFRSVAGDLRLPLDAPVVLLHGANGSGKTSVLSAIELALTGEVNSLARLDERYFAHLPHHGSDFAAVELDIADGQGSVTRQNLMTVGPGGLDGSPALHGSQRRFYSERSYLDQYSLGRLLEIYQHSESNQESSLERFVNELLGLDELDSLIGGLDDALDIRRLRKTAPQLASMEERQSKLLDDLKAATARRRALESEVQSEEVRLAELLELLDPAGSRSDLRTSGEVAEEADPSQASDRLNDLRMAVTQLTELRGRLQGLMARPAQLKLDELMQTRADSARKLEEWRASYQASLALLARSAEGVGVSVEENAQGLLDARVEVRRLSEELAVSLARHEEALTKAAELDERIVATSEAVSDLGSQVSQGQAVAGALATGLAEIVEHLDDDVCPVCDRDFAEVSSSGLRAHLEEKVRRIAGQGVELQQLVEARAAAQAELADLRELRDDINRRLVEEYEAEAIRDRRTRVDALAIDLEVAATWMSEGVALADQLQRFDGDISEARAISDDRAQIVDVLDAISSRLGAEAEAATPELRIEALIETATQEQDAASKRQALRQDASASRTRLDQLRTSLDELDSTIADLASQRDALDTQAGAVRERRDAARAIHSAALDERSEIIQRVFNRSLNRVWRDVFVRLAPDEVFVPSFGVPQTGRRAVAFSLQTVHRSGEIGGSPGAMLSAGNLNTAALSLFVSLHLAVEPEVACLVFDDPVQSMDEVHVSQFAALIRTLSKQLGRQVVIAVHEHELFEYLSLELSPAFDGDRLITIQLDSRTAGSTSALVEEIEFVDDLAVAVSG